MRAALLAGAFVLTGLAAAVIFLPLSAAFALAGADRLGLSSAGASGTVWDGQLTQAQWRGLPLGDLDVSADPLSVFKGRLELRLAAGGGPLSGRATVSAAPGGARITALSGQTPLSVLSPNLPVKGVLTLTDLSAAFSDGRCTSAQGRAELAPQSVPGLPAAMPALAGAARCADGAFQLPMTGGGAGGPVAVTLSLLGDGRYRAELRAAPTDPNVAASLRLAGFRQEGGEQVRVAEGRAFR